MLGKALVKVTLGEEGQLAAWDWERLIRGAGEPSRHPVPLGHPSSSPDRIFLAAGRAWQVANILEDGHVTLALAVKSHVKEVNIRSRLWSACTGQLGRIHSLWSAEEGYFNTISKADHRKIILAMDLANKHNLNDSLCYRHEWSSEFYMESIH